jgi:hypothetical protein
MADYTQGQKDFIDQMTRKLMVDLCHQSIINGHLPDIQEPDPYIDHALSKGWISKDRSKVLASGWSTATAFLKR